MEPLELQNILISCLKKSPDGPEKTGLTGLSPKDWDDLLDYASMQRIAPLLWHRLKQKNLHPCLPDTAVARLQEATRRNTMKNLRLNGEMARLLDELEKDSIPLIALKGIVMANAFYENIGLREMNDIDVIVPTDALERTAEILTGMGYRPAQPFSMDIILKTGMHLPKLIQKNTTIFEIHWNITSPGKPYSIEPHGLWQRAVPVEIAGRKVLILSPEDMLLHLCLHTSYQHPFVFGLRPFCDIAEAIDHYGSALNWQILTDRAFEQNWQRGIYLALLLAIDLSGASVPVEAIRRLAPNDISKTIVETARNQILTDKEFAQSIPAPFAEFLESRRLTDKLSIFFKRLFLPRITIAMAYDVPIDSPKLYGYYLRRLFDMLRRHKNTMKQYQGRDTAVMALAERTKAIADWIYGISREPVKTVGRPEGGGDR
jgi:hypothetical protein